MSRVSPEPLWAEGMMLRPQHLQSFQRHAAELITILSRSRTFSYGIRRLEIRPGGISNWVCDISECELIMPDGTYVLANETALIPPVEFRQPDSAPPTLDVWLGIPMHQASLPNLVESAQDGQGGRSVAVDRRWRSATRTIRDENTGANPQEVQFKFLNCRLFVGHPPPDGHVSLKIAELRKLLQEGAEGRVYEISDRFVPAALTLEAAPQLHGVVRDLLDSLESKNRDFVAKFGPAVRGMKMGLPGEAPEALIRLQASNGALAVLRELIRQPGMHPFDVYLQLVRLVGDLAVFSEGEWSPPPLPAYDHEGPLPAYEALRDVWLDLLRKAVKTKVRRVEFERSAVDPERTFEVAIPDPYLESGVELYLGIETELPGQEVARLFEINDLTLSGLEMLPRLRTTGGIQCVFNHRLVPELQHWSGLVFLWISQDEPFLWEPVRESKRLAIGGNAPGALDGVKFYLCASGVDSQ